MCRVGDQFNSAIRIRSDFTSDIRRTVEWAIIHREYCGAIVDRISIIYLKNEIVWFGELWINGSSNLD